MGDGVEATRLRQTQREWDGLAVDALVSVFPATRVAIGASEAAASLLLGPGWTFEPSFSFARRVTPAGPYVPWHIDYEAARTQAFGSDAITVWMPLTGVGDDAPGLELIRGSSSFMRERREPRIQHRSDEFVATVPGERWCPDMAPGDALFFDQHTLHRTRRVAAAFPPRISLELRFRKQEQ